MRWKFFSVLLIILINSETEGVDRTNFKSCEQSNFCKRCRNMEADNSSFEFLIDKAHIESQVFLQSELLDHKYNFKFSFHLYALENDIFRLKINELNPTKPRFEVPFVLVAEPSLKRLEILETKPEKLVLGCGDSTVHIYAKPFKLDIYFKEVLIISANARGLLRFEYHRQKPIKMETPEEIENNEKIENESSVDVEFSVESGAWEENFKSFHDSKPNGPEAVALDFSFPEAVSAYGLPEHTDSFALKSTKKSDPYRLYNLDVFEFELNNRMSLYAAVPLLFAHGPEATSGVFWLNSAETWVDVMSKGDQNVLASIVNLMSGTTSKPEVDAHFMSESGIIDAFLLLGPTPDDVFKQYASLTGTTPLPQMFSIAYHQCRWNYNDEEDVRSVVQKFDEYNIPLDAIWLDIEHADSKKYFTWDPVKFAHPIEMTQNLTEKGRKLVAIVDPHIKRDVGYFLHNDAEANGYYVKTPEGKDYEGWCWPGSSSYLDFLNPEVRQYYASRFLLENYKGSTVDTYIWNDMNEPSVFNGPEVTMPKDMVHYGGWEHRHIHNIYGFLHTMSTYDGLLKRSEGKLRPFLLTRSAFAGSQRYVAIWTGDMMAEWDHLKATLPMCLSLSISGLTLCGADVGGFFKNPEPELLVRWYQAGAFQPFFRAHAHIDTKRREPWLMGQANTDLIRAVIRKRYSYLPFWYTLMYKQETTAALVMKPLWAEFPKEEAVYEIEDEYLLGQSLLVHPVTEKDVTSITVYFPGTNEIWYDADTYEKFVDNGNVKISVDIEKIPVFIRGGSIIPKKERIRRASSLMKDDPYTLIVALNKEGFASGNLYMDDEESFDYRKGKFASLNLEFKNNKLSSVNENSKSNFASQAWLERVVIIGLAESPKIAELFHSGKTTSLKITYSPEQILIIRKPGVQMTQNWEIILS